mgnify:CR=1 FL=1
MKKKVIKYIDLFAGLGGIRLGFKQAFEAAGFETECVLTAEIKTADEYILKNEYLDFARVCAEKSAVLLKNNGVLPLKKDDKKMVNKESIKSEKGLRILIYRNLNKEIHGYTKPSIDFINKILDEAYESGMSYDVSDLYPAIESFAMTSTHQAEACMKIVSKMKFKSEEVSSGDEYLEDAPIVYFDVEVFPNLFLVNWKIIGEVQKGNLEAFAEKLLNSGATSSIDKENRIVKLFANSNAPKFIWWDEFEVSTRYTVFLKGKNGASLYPTDTNILCYYTDDTYEMLKIFDGNNSQVCWTSAANKTVRHIKGGYNAGSSTFEYDYVGLFKGALTLEDFEPYAGQILVPEVDGTVNEMTSRSPYMNIFADTVDVNIEATYNKSWGMKEASDRFCNALVQEVIYHSISFERLTLSKENIKSIINALSPTVTAQTITLKKSAKELFADDEWQSLISTKPILRIYLIISHHHPISSNFCNNRGSSNALSFCVTLDNRIVRTVTMI